MKKLGEFKDNWFPFSYLDHTRRIARAIIIDNENRVLVEKIRRDDDFGIATYYETPGGGIKQGETCIEALKREIKEECGLEIEVLQEIGYVEDDYNIIHRHNHSSYYLCKVVKETEMKREPNEVIWIQNLLFMSLKEIIDICSHPDTPIAKIVYQREKVVYQEAKDLLKC